MRSLATGSALLTLSLLFAAQPSFAADEYGGPSLQLWQTGVTAALQVSANNGRGVTIGVVDTGLYAAHNEFAGRVLAASTCVATGNCGAGYADTFGHGTFVASIAAAAKNNFGIVGVAPEAKLLAVKIAQPNGAANYGDLINGLTTAAARGANVINLSYGSFYGAPYASYNSYLVAALNTTAAKNAVTVIAGGNSGTTFIGNINQGGFTAAALNRLLFVGSVNNKNVKSSFSNTPGASVFSAATGQKRALADIWLMAPGENLIGANPSSSTRYVYGSGTSFAAPLVAGAVALLESRWPVLTRNGTAAQVLLDTAQDLGAAGIDAVYGHGLIRVDRAFNPIGYLMVTNASGKKVAANLLTGGVVTSGAFGSLTNLATRLSNMVALDNYQRDFYVNLSSLVLPANRNATLNNTMLSHLSVTSGGAKFADGSVLAFGQSQNRSRTALAPSGEPAQSRDWFVNYTDAAGTTLAGGHGFAPGSSFNAALWGANGFVGDDMALLDASNVLFNMASGGGFTAFGRKLGDSTRMAFTFSQTAAQDPLRATTGNAPDARALGFGVSREVVKGWVAGLTVGTLDEANGLLGATYGNSPIGFGPQHNSVSIGASSAIALGETRSLLLDAAWVRSDGATMPNGLIADVSAITARSMGAAFVQRDAFKEDDRLAISLRKPLTVTGGSASLVTTSVDSLGYVTTCRESIDLRPDGSETVMGISYEAPIKEQTRWNASFTYRDDANNLRGAQDATLMLGIKMAF